MSTSLIHAFVPIILFICIATSICFACYFRYQTLVKIGRNTLPKAPIKIRLQKLGIVVIGFSVGLILVSLGFALELMYHSWNGFLIVGIISLCVGISLIIADRVDANKVHG